MVLAHSPAAPPLARDLLLSSWIGVLAGLAYAAWLSFGSTYLRGRGRWLLLAIDFFIGGSTGLAGALLPRAHTGSLLALSPAPLALPAPASIAALLAMTALLLLATGSRAGR
ncbi:MAG: hypothetical protein R3F14_12675 [Polyangiaceae bacterium]